MAEATSMTMPPTETVEDFFICSICHNDLQDTATTICGHRYCLGCIRQWLDNSSTCPCCNKQLPRNSLIQDRQFDSFIVILKIELQKHKETTELKETLEAELTCLKDTVKEKELLTRQAQTQQKELENTIRIFQTETKRLKDEIASKEQSFKKEKDILLQKLSSAQAQIRQKDQLLKETEKKLENEQALTRQLQQDLEMSQNNCQLLTAHIEFLQHEQSMLLSQLESLHQIDKTCRLLEDKVTEIEQDKRSLIGKNCRLSSENEALLQQEREHNGALMKSKHEVSQLKQQLAEAKDDIRATFCPKSATQNMEQCLPAYHFITKDLWKCVLCRERIKRMHENYKSSQMKIEGLTEDLYKKEQKITLSRHFIISEQ